MDCKCPAIIIYELFTLGDFVLFVGPTLVMAETKLVGLAHAGPNRRRGARA